MPQTMTKEWEAEIGELPESVHIRLKDTFGNLSMTSYNTELGNLPFKVKKEKLKNTHIELNRFFLEQKIWNEDAILSRAESMFKTAASLWIGPIASIAIDARISDVSIQD
jgi:hypothetical protein